MRNWVRNLVGPDAEARSVIAALDSTQQKIVFVVDEQRRLLGSITDGDVRRALLRGLDLSAPAEHVMNHTPITASISVARDEVITRMRSASIRYMPLLDGDGIVLDIAALNDEEDAGGKDNWVVLMAGGLGTRLRPLTDDVPKPLIPVGGKPLLETIIQCFIDHGFRRFFVSLNYKGELIKQHFGDGSRLGCQIIYIEEDERMGTAGALRLLPDRPTAPLIVMNGDLLTSVNFSHLLDYHREHKSAATMCVREYNFQVPFGVVEMDAHRIIRIEEKPLQRFFVNAGIYVINPHLLNLMPDTGFYDMTELYAKAIEGGNAVAAFPVREYWLDIGRHDDLKRANLEFAEVFAR
ncbi:conserved protein of unknown function [Magnetospirillum gryphiswaldense MSR-1 v2]|uniref:CBS domain-containing protein n=1 Tax=Magnetospirillum gryphiswaldense (strain DSM 6361 / JCM 21280 / NBRC 15271 / MSR-1) TaxID=431944 RepID=V6F898_MAGGM|nr:nucleotidyltransferase family protein [Magnetospirillum gryphiswaldense]CDL00626.1 conserved protein of unknown function [Magnetospirillum gryphiswaldense MSR-1 v2]